VATAYVAGVHTTAFGRLLERTHKDLAAEAVGGALSDAGLEGSAPVESVWFGSCALHAWGQPNVAGQVCLAPLVDAGVLPAGTPVVNVEGACATGALAFRGAWQDVASGEAELSLALGVEKTHFPDDPARSFALFDAALDRLDPAAWEERYRSAAEAADLPFAPRPDRLVLLDVAALVARRHMQRHGTTAGQLAAVAAKNTAHGALNPLAQRRQERTADEVLADRPIVEPLTRAMCAPLSDGAAAVVVCSERLRAALPPAARERLVPVRASVLGGGAHGDLDAPRVAATLAERAYARAGLGPDEVDVAEVHDATAFAEVALTEALGLCPAGEGGPYAASGATRLGGARPVNPSGGLLARGHPLAATGLAMIAELATQLRGEAGDRQVAGARVALAETGGGLVGFDDAVASVTILGAPG